MDRDYLESIIKEERREDALIRKGNQSIENKEESASLRDMKKRAELKEERREEKRERELREAEDFTRRHSNPDAIDRELDYLEANEERQE